MKGTPYSEIIFERMLLGPKIELGYYEKSKTFIGSAITIFELFNIKIGESLCVPVASRIKKAFEHISKT